MPTSEDDTPERPAADDLAGASCEPCRVGAPLMAPGEIASGLAKVPSWHLVEKNGIQRIERAFAFSNFAQAMRFAVAVGELAEREGHHPELHVSWGRVVVETWTHKIEGLHRNDFILAAKTDAIYAGSARS
jgi:4a-hydroxytetrahydrobiopterin dehydratase